MRLTHLKAFISTSHSLLIYLFYKEAFFAYLRLITNVFFHFITENKISIVYFATYVITWGINLAITTPLSPNLLLHQAQCVYEWVPNSISTNCLVSQAVICTAQLRICSKQNRHSFSAAHLCVPAPPANFWEVDNSVDWGLLWW